MVKKLLAVLVAAGVMATAPGANAQDKIRIGFLAPLSGPLSLLSREMERGLDLALARLHNKIGGIPVEVFKVDSRMSAASAMQVATKLLEEDKINFLTGLLLSNQTMALAKPVTSKGVFMLSATSGPGLLAGKGCNPYVFVLSWENEGPSEAIGKYMAQQHIKSVFAISQNYVTGRDHVRGVWYYYKGKRVGEAYVPRTQVDYSAEIARIRAANPEAVFMFLPGRGGIAFLKQMKGVGLMKKIKIFGGSWVADELSFKALGDSAIGIQVSNPWFAQLDNPANKAFVAAFRKKYGRNPVFYAAFQYDVINLLNAAVKEAGGIKDKAKLRAAIEHANFHSVRGRFRFNVNHYPIQDEYIARVVKKNGVLQHQVIGKAFVDQKDRYYTQCKMPK